MPKYNGVDLPAPPAGWDQKTFPHACVVLLEIGYIFEVMTEPMTFNNPFYSAPAGHQYKNWILTDGAWVGGDAVYTSATGSSYSPDEVIWTSTDIKDDSDKVYMEGTLIVYDKWSGLKRWLIEMLCDRAGKQAQQLPAPGEPVAYLYNGVRLPALPEWDETAYPYAMISNEVLNSVVFTAYAERPSTNMATIVNPYDAAIPLVRSFLSTDGKSWGELTEGRLFTEGQNSLPFWAKFDVIHADGTTYLAASKPVPVYE